jgi:hypothetical protein
MRQPGVISASTVTVVFWPDLAGHRQRLVLAQRQQLADGGADHHMVACGQHHLGHAAAEREVAPDHVDHHHAVAGQVLDAEHRAADHVGPGGDHHLGEEFELLAAGEEIDHGAAHRQQAPGRQRDEAHRHGDDDQRHRGDLEQGERLQPVAARNAIDQQVGRGADQRAHAAENGGVGERDQQLGCGKMQHFAQAHRHRHHHHHDGGVVHEGRRHGGEPSETRHHLARVLLDPGR